MAAPALTPLGERTKAGFEKKWGKKSGDKKFEDAMDNGLIDRGKMENLGLAADSDAASEGTEAPGDDEAEGELDQPGDGGGSMGPLPMMGPPPPLPPVRKLPKKKLPVGLARGAPGKFQRRPG
jgi:hypothetical protein